MKYIVDTHALIWFLEGNLRLGINAKTILANSNSSLVLSAIVLAEAVWIVDRGKTSIPYSGRFTQCSRCRSSDTNPSSR